MKTNIGFLLALVIVLGACKSQDNEIIEYAEDGTLLKRTVFTDSGNRDHYREYFYYPNGEIKSLTEYTNGVRDGRDFAYYDDGSIKTVFYYINGKLNSIGRFYDSKGLITDKGLFINDSLVVKEEFFYKDNLTQVNVFARNGDTFEESGNMLYDDRGRFAAEHSAYYFVSSADSIQLGDSLKITVDLLAPSDKSSSFSLVLGEFNEKLEFTAISDDMVSNARALIFYYKPAKTGYNLLTGKLAHNIDKDAGISHGAYIFYHDFLVY
ncbi:MAG: hypothetical protein JXQ80_10800 [Bacteroidales bacterium]|nr:hypothetical protein [Bacteroidales bacterium]